MSKYLSSQNFFCLAAIQPRHDQFWGVRVGEATNLGPGMLERVDVLELVHEAIREEIRRIIAEAGIATKLRASGEGI